MVLTNNAYLIYIGRCVGSALLGSTTNTVGFSAIYKLLNSFNCGLHGGFGFSKLLAPIPNNVDSISHAFFDKAFLHVFAANNPCPGK